MPRLWHHASRMERFTDLPLFLLHTVLFPEDRLPLRVFEARYLDMISDCLRKERPFGVCLIRQGQEIGEPAEPVKIGTLASIEQWDMTQPGVLDIVVRGGPRFELERSRLKGKLVVGDARLWSEEQSGDIPDDYDDLPQLLEQIIDKYEAKSIRPPYRLADARWVGMRLASILPVEPTVKQEWLEVRDPMARLASIRLTLVQIAADKTA